MSDSKTLKYGDIARTPVTILGLDSLISLQDVLTEIVEVVIPDAVNPDEDAP